MLGMGSEHPTATKTYRTGEGVSQKGVQGMFRVGDREPFSPMGHPGVSIAKGHPCFQQAGSGSP